MEENLNVLRRKCEKSGLNQTDFREKKMKIKVYSRFYNEKSSCELVILKVLIVDFRHCEE